MLALDELLIFDQLYAFTVGVKIWLLFLMFKQQLYRNASIHNMCTIAQVNTVYFSCD